IGRPLWSAFMGGLCFSSSASSRESFRRGRRKVATTLPATTARAATIATACTVRVGFSSGHAIAAKKQASGIAVDVQRYCRLGIVALHVREREDQGHHEHQCGQRKGRNREVAQRRPLQRQ